MHVPCTKDSKKNSLVAKVGKTFQKSVEVKPRMDSRPAGKRTPTWWHNGNDIVFSPNSSHRKSLQAGRIVFFFDKRHIARQKVAHLSAAQMAFFAQKQQTPHTHQDQALQV